MDESLRGYLQHGLFLPGRVQAVAQIPADTSVADPPGNWRGPAVSATMVMAWERTRPHPTPRPTHHWATSGLADGHASGHFGLTIFAHRPPFKNQAVPCLWGLQARETATQECKSTVRETFRAVIAPIQYSGFIVQIYTRSYMARQAGGGLGKNFQDLLREEKNNTGSRLRQRRQDFQRFGGILQTPSFGWR